MPQPKDITGDLGKLRKRKALAPVAEPPSPKVPRLERKPAFNASSFFFWTLLFLFLGLQFVFFAWLA